MIETPLQHIAMHLILPPPIRRQRFHFYRFPAVLARWRITVRMIAVEIYLVSGDRVPKAERRRRPGTAHVFPLRLRRKGR